jgi:hypothetical protein
LEVLVLALRGMRNGTDSDHQFDKAHGDVLRAIFFNLHPLTPARRAPFMPADKIFRPCR